MQAARLKVLITGDADLERESAGESERERRKKLGKKMHKTECILQPSTDLKNPWKNQSDN